MNEKYVDLLERAAWTAAQAALSLLVVGLADVPTWWALPVATVLSAAKSWVLGRSKAS